MENNSKGEGITRRKFIRGLTAAGAAAAIPKFVLGEEKTPQEPDEDNDVYMPQVYHSDEREPLTLEELQPAMEALLPYTRNPYEGEIVRSSRGPNTVGIKDWEHEDMIKIGEDETKRIFKKDEDGSDVLTEEGIEELARIRINKSTNSGEKHYTRDINGKIKELKPEIIHLPEDKSGERRRKVRKVAEVKGPADLTIMHFTRLPKVEDLEDLPGGIFEIFIECDGEITVLDLKEYFKNQGNIKYPYLHNPNDNSPAFISNLPFEADQKLNIYLSNSFFNSEDEDWFWYNFHIRKRKSGETKKAVNLERNAFEEISKFANEAEERQDYSQLLSNILTLQGGPETSKKHTAYFEQGEAIKIENGATMTSLGAFVTHEQLENLAESTVEIKYIDGEILTLKGQEFFLMMTSFYNKRHASVYNQAGLAFEEEKEDLNGKIHVSLNIPLSGVSEIKIEGDENLEFTGRATAIQTDLLPQRLRDKKIHFETEVYNTQGGGDDVELTSPDMNVVASVMSMKGKRKEGQWPYYFMEQGPMYYEKVIDENGLVRYVPNGPWSGGEDMYGSFYDGEHSINGGLYGLKQEEASEEQYYINYGEQWFGLPFSENMVSFIPDIGADHHKHEYNFHLGNLRYEWLETTITRVGYRDKNKDIESRRSFYFGEHYLAYEMNENLYSLRQRKRESLTENQARFLGAAERVSLLEQQLLEREGQGTTTLPQKPITIPSFWRSIQAISEYYRDVRDNELLEQDDHVMYRVKSDFYANFRLTIKDSNYPQAHNWPEINDIFDQEDELRALELFSSILASYLDSEGQ